MLSASIALCVLAAIPAEAPPPDRDSVSAIVAQALADAEGRSSLLQSGDASGYDGGFVIRDDQGDFELGVSGQMQFRYMASWRDDAGGTDGFVSGFQSRRLKVTFSGHVFDESLRFKITNSFSRSSGNDSLSDAYVEKVFDDGLVFQWGQFKLPFTREFLDSSKRLLAVERSLVDGEFRADRGQGVQLAIGDGPLRGWVAFSDGADTTNTDFGAHTADWAISARAEWLASGSSKTFKSEAGRHDAESSLRLGGAVYAAERDSAPGDVGGRTSMWTGDITAAGEGWIAFASIDGRDAEDTTGASFTDWGATAQLGVWLAEDILPFVRWEILIPDDARTGNSETNILTAGANWYLHGEALKVTIDGVWLVDNAGDNDLIGNATGNGVLAPGPGDDEFVIRLQAQLLF